MSAPNPAGNHTFPPHNSAPSYITRPQKSPNRQIISPGGQIEACVIRFRELTGSQLSDLGVLVREDAVSDEEAGVSDDDALVCASETATQVL
jgi:hypothetical protein